MIPDHLKAREPLTREEVDTASDVIRCLGAVGHPERGRLIADWYRGQALIAAAELLINQESEKGGDHPCKVYTSEGTNLEEKCGWCELFKSLGDLVPRPLVIGGKYGADERNGFPTRHCHDCKGPLDAAGYCKERCLMGQPFTEEREGQ